MILEVFQAHSIIAIADQRSHRKQSLSCFSIIIPQGVALGVELLLVCKHIRLKELVEVLIRAIAVEGKQVGIEGFKDKALANDLISFWVEHLPGSSRGLV